MFVELYILNTFSYGSVFKSYRQCLSLKVRKSSGMYRTVLFPCLHKAVHFIIKFFNTTSRTLFSNTSVQYTEAIEVFFGELNGC